MSATAVRTCLPAQAGSVISQAPSAPSFKMYLPVNRAQDAGVVPNAGPFEGSQMVAVYGLGLRV